MDFDLDQTQTLLKDSVARYLEKAYDLDGRRAVIRDGGFSPAQWATFVEMGWVGAALSESHGGYGGATEAAIVLEEFGRVLVTEPFLAVAVLAAQTLVGCGDERSMALVSGIVSGEARPVLAHGEPAARGHIAWTQTVAVPEGGGWRLSGRKSLVLGAPFADLYLVSARTGGGAADREGLTLFAIAPDAAGLSRTDLRLADGARASELVLDGVEASPADVLGEVGRAYPALDRGYAHAICGLCAEAVGAMDRALWLTRDYVQAREQFGQPIGRFQSIQHRMAEMLIELELSRSILYRALAHIDAEPQARAQAMAAAKVQIGKSAKFVGGQAIQLHGGIGVTEEYSIGQYFKRLTLLDNLFGPVQTHLETLVAGSRTIAAEPIN